MLCSVAKINKYVRFFFNFYWSIVALQCCVVSAVEQRGSVVHIPIAALFLDSFPY